MESLSQIIHLLLKLLVITIIIGVLSKIISCNLKKKMYLNSPLSKIDTMSGEEFEEYLSFLFKESGYKVKMTPKKGDYGLDLILKKNGLVTGVQAKRYKKNVGVSAIQEAIGGMTHYGCDNVMVVTNSYFTKPAMNLASSGCVKLVDRDNINKFVKYINKKKPL